MCCFQSWDCFDEVVVNAVGILYEIETRAGSSLFDRSQTGSTGLHQSFLGEFAFSTMACRVATSDTPYVGKDVVLR